jgi:DNA-binding MarR family transcriptional regulator
MTITADALLALRHRVADAVLLDWTDLAQLVEAPGTVRTRVLREHWHCSQATVSRRLRRLWKAELLDYCPGRGAYHIRRLGPVKDCNNPPTPR